MRAIDICDKLTGYAFYLLAAAVAFSNAFTEIATSVIVAMWIIKRVLKKNYTLPDKRLGLILLLFILWNLASFINTGYMPESVRGLIKVVKHLFLFMATIDYLRARPKIEKLLLFMLGCGFIIALNGIAQYILPSGMDMIRQRTIDPLDHLHRVSSSFKHANDFGAYLVVLLSVLMGLFFSKKRFLKERILLLIIILPLAWCLLATDSRGAWLGFIIAFLSLAIMKSRKLLVAILILVVLSPIFLPSSVKGRFSDFSEIGSGGGTVWERIKLWSGTLAMVKAHPFLGVGVNTYTRNFPMYKPKDYPDIRYTHNSYLHMAAEIGIIGAGIFLLFIIILLVSAARAIKGFERGLTRDLAYGLLAGTIGFLAHCLVDTHFYSVTLSAFLYLCLGLAVVFRNIAYEKRT